MTYGNSSRSTRHCSLVALQTGTGPALVNQCEAEEHAVHKICTVLSAVLETSA